MSDSIGTAVSLSLFGESHGAAIGAVLQGVPSGTKIDEEFIAKQMELRRAKGKISTARTEADRVVFLSGVYSGYATGTAIAFIIENTNTKSQDYAKTENIFRPGHADYTAQIKYKGFQDARGGGHFSGRLTAPIVAAGAICKYALQQKGILIGTHVLKCAGVADDGFSADDLNKQISLLNNSEFAVLSTAQGEKMIQKIEQASAAGDSVGGVLETAITGISAGIGEPFFNSVESVLSHYLFSMPAVKGVEFGAGFAISDMLGSKANDAFFIESNTVKTLTNNNGGINGGITNAMPIILRTAVKPTPSIYTKQQSINFNNLQNTELQIQGRHDPCIVHRARIVQDSLCALAIADLLAQNAAHNWA